MKKIMLLVMFAASLFATNFQNVKYQKACINNAEFLTTIVLDQAYSKPVVIQATTIALYEENYNTSYPLKPKKCNYKGIKIVKGK